MRKYICPICGKRADKRERIEAGSSLYRLAGWDYFHRIRRGRTSIPAYHCHFAADETGEWKL